jgi:putative membrane protein
MEFKMKAKLVISAIALSLLCSSGFVAANTHHNSANTKATSQEMQQDDNAIAVLIVLNKNEINAGKEALKKSKNSTVREFAKHMEKQHTANLNDTLKVMRKIHASDKPTTESKDLKEKGKKELTELSSLKGAEFDKAYINAMVKGHEDALQLAESLASKVNNKALKEHLEATATTIKHHLEMAKEAQSKIA